MGNSVHEALASEGRQEGAHHHRDAVGAGGRLVCRGREEGKHATIHDKARREAETAEIVGYPVKCHRGRIVRAQKDGDALEAVVQEKGQEEEGQGEPIADELVEKPYDEAGREEEVGAEGGECVEKIFVRETEIDGDLYGEGLRGIKVVEKLEAYEKCDDDQDSRAA